MLPDLLHPASKGGGAKPAGRRGFGYRILIYPREICRHGSSVAIQFACARITFLRIDSSADKCPIVFIIAPKLRNICTDVNQLRSVDFRPAGRRLVSCLGFYSMGFASSTMENGIPPETLDVIGRLPNRSNQAAVTCRSKPWMALVKCSA
jgi:hypothetical protein